jgi:intein/homing endonuclease
MDYNQLAEQSKQYFRNPLAEFVYYRTYSKWIEEEGENLGDKLTDAEYTEVREAILNQEAMPSMRLLQFAGKATQKTNVAAYNCSFIAPSKIKDFGEIMYVLMCGTGVGFSVESETAQALPQIKKQNRQKREKYIIEDSREGWADALINGMQVWFEGGDVEFDYSQLRPAGTRLKTMGGKSSGPQPLIDLMVFVRAKIVAKQGRHLSNLDVHDIICKIGEIVVSGGVRRCLPTSTQVHVKGGIKNIEQLKNNELVLTDDGSYQKIVAIENTGKKPVVQINTTLGYLSSSPEHRWAVKDMNGDLVWKQANQLLIGDRIGLINYINPGTKTTLPEWIYIKPEKSTRCTDIKIPKLDENIAWFFGQVHGDGYVHLEKRRGRIVVTTIDNKTYNRVVECFKQFGVNAYTPPQHDKYKKPTANSKQLAQYFSQFKRPHQSIDIPDFIKQALPQIKGAYIAGLFDADGYLPSNHTTQKTPVVLSTIYPKYAQQVCDLLSTIGIASKMIYARPAVGNWQAIYNIHIYGYKAFDNWNQFVMPYSIKQNQQPLKLLKERKAFHENFVEVLGINNLTDKAEMWDIEVEKNHNFIVSFGAISHNSALISLSDLNDYEMRNAKTGQFYLTEPQRSLANNSAVYWQKPTESEFMEEWLSLMKSGTGERGIFNKGAILNQVPERRRPIIEPDYETVGTNPCGEIILKSKQFCNLSEIVCRPDDDEKSLLKKARLATIIGTYQSSLTNLGYLSKKWKDNCEQERLLGVSLTGQWDCPAVRNADTLKKIKNYTLRINKEYAERFKINPSTSITCVKPSGNLSQVVDSSSGIHARYAPYYIRRVRIASTDSLYRMMKDQHYPFYPEVGQSEATTTTWVAEFPVKSPKSKHYSITMNAMEQLEYWKLVKENYTEHNPSCTISIEEGEWIQVAHWLYQNWEIIGGLSFLPKNKHVYQLAPYEEITEAQYEKMVNELPKIDFGKILEYEKEDTTDQKAELACAGGNCSIDDIVVDV